MKFFIVALSFSIVSNTAFAANNCLGAAVQISQNFVVPGTSLKQVSYEATKDTKIEKYMATLQSNSSSLVGYVIIILSASDCSEIMSFPGN